MKQGNLVNAFLRHIYKLPLSWLSLSRGKRLLIVAFTYGLAVPGLWLLFPILQNGASMLLPIISASFLFRYRGLFIALVLNGVAFWLVYHFLLPDVMSGLAFVK